ncbi:energy-coupling factor transporter transmembrane component T [Zhihengliuella halotolerans]|uniref:Energy-coupling factor transport system permease protein n=1 Tax=Zhihengliuella halotolerans TaxID=370736 RepID=A0A4Q8ABV4_9MICC|nr:energy-coupling factor transporter transmembrane component T [Zhihengliuella halotolerans]RZU61171.1 energy-coupling factor transport system permease protein [Zhihengliuella halotolerans]
MPVFARLHPFTVLAVAAAVVTTTTALGTWLVTLAVVLTCLALAAAAGKLTRLAAAALAILTPAWGSQLIIHGLVGRTGERVLASAGPLRITEEGLETAAGLAARLSVLVVVGLLCALVIDPHDLVAGVDLSPAPPQAGYLVAASLSVLPRLAARQRAIGEAQALRGARIGRGPVGWWTRLRLRSVPLVLSAVHDAADRAPHLAARGFPPRTRVTRLRVVPDSRAQRVVRRIALAAAVVAPAALLALPALLPGGDA